MSNKTKLLITGGSGFLGRNLALALKDEYEVILGSRNNKQNAYAANLTGCETHPLDIVNIESIRDVVKRTNPKIIIHAAATKFVDLSEKYPLEAVDVNVVGSQNVARVAIDNGVEYVLGISTDKASPPVRNIYGMSKAMMEKMFCLLDGKSDTKFSCIRYGNVAWSTGSVLPIWKKMWNDTKIIKTTGPEMRRFFFSIEDAVNFVKFALEYPQYGKIVCRSMKSSKIEDVLRVWISNFGGKWEKMEGRPGERLDEYIIGEAELSFTSPYGTYDNISYYTIDQNKRLQFPELSTVLSSENAIRLTDDEILKILKSEPDTL